MISKTVRISSGTRTVYTINFTLQVKTSFCVFLPSGADDLEKLDMKEMLSILQFGADRIFQGDGGAMPTDSELDAIMDRSGMLANQVGAHDALSDELMSM